MARFFCRIKTKLNRYLLCLVYRRHQFQRIAFEYFGVISVKILGALSVPDHCFQLVKTVPAARDFVLCAEWTSGTVSPPAPCHAPHLSVTPLVARRAGSASH